jgi:hypothetical protein
MRRHQFSITPLAYILQKILHSIKNQQTGRPETANKEANPLLFTSVK